jgi:diguanylate cyclase (GGDEF)-like protein
VNGAGVIHGRFDAGLVGLSVTIAVIAAYASLDFARRAVNNTVWHRRAWLAGGALTMGCGIWGMHFVGMLSFKMPMSVSYQPVLVALSLIAAVGGSGIALAVVTRAQVSTGALLIGAAFMGCAIASMHFLGMASMQMAATIHWNIPLVVLSVLIGFGASLLALSLVVRINAGTRRLRFSQSAFAALLLGLAISGLHFTAMTASTFYMSARSVPPGSMSTSSLNTVLAVAGAIALIMLLAVVAADQRRAEFAVDLALVAGISRDLRRGADIRGRVCEAALRLTAADHVALLEPDQHDLVKTTASYGQGPAEAAHAEADRNYERTIIRSARRTFLPARAETSSALSRTSDQISTLYEPLILDGRPVALFAVRWARRVRSLPDRTALLLEMLAADAAVVIDRDDLMTRLELLARYDELTGLANRRALFEELERAISAAKRQGQPMSVIMLDFDHFKELNDSQGHQAGDALLSSSAAAWTEIVRTTDTVARYGGDEFVVVLPDCSQELAVSTADRLRAVVPHDTSCSAGVATWDAGETPGQLVDRADQALYQAKQAGRAGTAVSESRRRRVGVHDPAGPAADERGSN